MLVKLSPLINFINILQTAFASIFFAKKSQSQTVIREKLCKALFVQKKLVSISPTFFAQIF